MKIPTTTIPIRNSPFKKNPSQESPDHKERVLVTWPANTVFPDELSSAAKMAEEQQAPVVISREDGLVMARPLTLNGAAFGAIVILVDAGNDQQAVIKQLLDWSCSWLELILRAGTGVQQSSDDDALTLLNGLLEFDELNPAAISLVTYLADSFNCERVSIGILGDDGIDVTAISHRAEFDPRVNLVGMMQSAMEESLRTDSVLIFNKSDQQKPAAIAHELLAEELKGSSLLTVPVKAKSKAIGALLFEGKSNFSTQEISRI